MYDSIIAVILVLLCSSAEAIDYSPTSFARSSLWDMGESICWCPFGKCVTQRFDAQEVTLTFEVNTVGIVEDLYIYLAIGNILHDFGKCPTPQQESRYWQSAKSFEVFFFFLFF